MENVKGILSSQVSGGAIFGRIMADLQRPSAAGRKAGAPEYVLMPLTAEGLQWVEPEPSDFILKAEEFGIPQARHRVVILGIRSDVHARLRAFNGLQRSKPPTVQQVLGDLPSLSPQVSSRGNGTSWLEALQLPLFDKALRELRLQWTDSAGSIADLMEGCRNALLARQHGPGSGQRQDAPAGKRPTQEAARPAELVPRSGYQPANEP